MPRSLTLTQASSLSNGRSRSPAPSRNGRSAALPPPLDTGSLSGRSSVGSLGLGLGSEAPPTPPPRPVAAEPARPAEPDSADKPVDVSWPSGLRKQCVYLSLAPIMLPLYLTLADVKKPVSS